MRKIDLIVIHCSATREDRPFTEHDLDTAHRLRGFDGIGYHFYVRRNGDIKSTRTVERVGAHARGYNAHSIGICYEGGLDSHGLAKDTRTEWQRHSGTGAGAENGLSGGTGSGTPGSESGCEWKRGGGTDGVDEGMSVL